jgi:hypothetical protein
MAIDLRTCRCTAANSRATDICPGLKLVMGEALDFELYSPNSCKMLLEEDGIIGKERVNLALISTARWLG